MTTKHARSSAVDLVAIGETMLSVAPAAGRQFHTESSFDVAAAGAESNVCATVARLGLRSAWLSRVGNDVVGETVLHDIGRRGVDVSGVRVDPRRRTGLMIKNPHSSRTDVVYYRSGSAASRMSPTDARRAPSCRVAFISGITPALSPSCSKLTYAVLTGRAIDADLVAFDVNFRPSLWSSTERAAQQLLAHARAADVVFVGRDEAEDLWATSTAEEIRQLLPDVPHLVVKDAAHDALEFSGGRTCRRPASPADVVDAVGAGDAFAAGWLAGWLVGSAAADRLDLGHKSARAVLSTVADQATDITAVREHLLRLRSHGAQSPATGNLRP